MTGELLAIVQAEERAETIVASAEEKKERTLQKAREDRHKRIGAVKPPKQKEVSLKPLAVDLDKLKEQVKKNKATAVKKILEEFHATA